MANNFPFEMLSHDAQLTLELAQKESENAGQTYIGTEHVLLGLLGVEPSQAARVLKRLKVSSNRVRSVVNKFRAPAKSLSDRPLIPTSRVRRIIELGFDEARRMGHPAVDTGHLLIGLIIEGSGMARLLLEDLGATGERVIAEAERELGAPLSGRTQRIRPLPPSQTSRLGDPPPNIAALRDKLASVQLVLRNAVSARDREHVQRLGVEEDRLQRELAKAEQEWLDSRA